MQQKAKSHLLCMLILQPFPQHSPKLESLRNNCWMRHFMLVILETTPPSPAPANARPQMVEPHPPPPPLQEKQGPYFLWLQAGFRSLCPLIYQRTAVLRLCDDQSPLPSVSLAQSLFYLPLFSSIFSLQSPSLPIFLLPHLPYCLLFPVSMLQSLLSVQTSWPLCAPSFYSLHMDSSGICFLSVHTHKLEKSQYIQQLHLPLWQCILWSLQYKQLMA